MNDFWQSLASFFTGNGFEPHGECYLWTPGLIRLHVISDSLVALAYYSIPVMLVWFVLKRKDVPFSWIFTMFGIFIIACGTTHVVAIYEIWHGAYWLSGVVKAVTAGASILTAVMCVPLLPKALTLRTPAELDRINRALSRSLEEKDQILALYQREKRVATLLQEALLPKSMPAVPGLAFDACYMPGATEAEIGGDWYDAFVRGDGTVFLSIGDVAGRGLEAAATMGRLRQALRTIAQEQDDPGHILQLGEDVLSLDAPEAMATAVVAFYDPRTGLLRYANAGHPPPFVRHATGEVATLDERGLPLGLAAPRPAPIGSVQLAPGASLLLYTDGLIEAGRDVVSGIEALRATLQQDGRALSARAVAGRVLAEGSPDDVAILLMSVLPATRDFELSLSAVPQNARVARRALTRELERRGLSADKVFEVELAAGEAIMNAIEHAYGNVTGAFGLSLTETGDSFVICISDAGKWRSHVSSEGRGRGFGIMRRFTNEVAVSREGEGTSVTLIVKKT